VFSLVLCTRPTNKQTNKHTHITYILLTRTSLSSVSTLFREHRLLTRVVSGIMNTYIYALASCSCTKTLAPVQYNTPGTSGNIRLNVTLMRVRITIVPVQNHYILHILCVCSLRYLACALLHRHMWRAWLHRVSYTSTTCRKKVTVHKARATIFSTTFSETFLILKRNERDTMNVCRSSCKVSFIFFRI